VVEYEVLVNHLCIVAKLGVQRLYIHRDSDHVINQVMGESNCRKSCMAAYGQEVRKLEEKLDGFELHHILKRDNKAANALARLGSRHEAPPPGVFMQNLFKPSIQLKEDIPIPMPGISPGEDSPVPVLGTPQGKDGPIPISKANPGASTGPTGPNWDLGGEIPGIVGVHDHDAD
jgi:hypothetical protein